ncbi:aromatic ring-opening dioxygenase LigA [Actinotalea sp. BY-33]|uniref:Aromatic ring-opening dioxygenase LigA n=1 Tax=Actinotalea soli TaxID=2819234 RepID=A0A939LQR2_9CELL|nr:aromatic ring-opening dioxygenase LigA [Actinotalea soli]MBO1752263.1 aromatic ring-opening dioxygenase LigA [Actinotalea soli]
MNATVSNAKPVKIIGLIAMIAGAVLIIAGAATALVVRDQLVAENITLGEDAAMFQGNVVDGPIDAYLQAEVIDMHAREMAGGQTYAELDREDPIRATVMNGSFLRASLFTSIIAFGIAAFAAGMGILFILVGWALRKLVDTAPVTTANTPVQAV